MTTEQQAIYLNAIPLLALGGLFLLATASLFPSLVRERGRLRELELALALIFLCGGTAALLFGLLVLRQREPVGGEPWLALLAILLALLPAVVFFARFRDRSLLLTGGIRAREAEEHARLRGATTFDEAARVLLDRACALVRAELGALVLVEDDGKEGRAVLGRRDGADVDWAPTVRIDLENEPSGVASAYHDAAAFAVFDSSTLSEAKGGLVDRSAARSVAYVPLFAHQRVTAVLVVASIAQQRVFSDGDLDDLRALAAEAGPVVERLRRAGEHPTQLERDAVVARIADLVRSRTDVDAVLRIAVEEVARVASLDRCYLRLVDLGDEMPVAVEWRRAHLDELPAAAVPHLVVSNLAVAERRTVTIEDVAAASALEESALGGRGTMLELGARAVVAVPVLVFDRLLGVLVGHRTSPGPWRPGDAELLETVARELGFALYTTDLLAGDRRRLERQTALLDAAQALTSELSFERVLDLLVDELVVLVGADAADCWLFDEDRRMLRCRAVRGLPPGEIGREIEPGGTIGRVIETRRPALTQDFAVEQPPPSENYRQFEEAMGAPVVVLGEVRGVLGVCSRTSGRFDQEDLELLDAFATLASLALRNAEAFEESSRQAQIQRGFYRIASALGRPLSLAATLEAVAEAAADALGAACAAVLMPRGPGELVLAGSHGVPQPLRRELELGIGDDETLRLAVEERRIIGSPKLVGDERFGGRWRELAERSGFRSLLLVPVETREVSAAGLVLVLFPDERRLRDEDLELARHLAGAARAALERSDLFEAERRSRSLAQQLSRTGMLLATALDPAAVLDEVVERAPALLDADACVIRSVEGDELVVMAVWGEGTASVLGERSDAAGWLSGEVVQSRKPIVVEDTSHETALVESDPLLADAGYIGYMGTPLVGPGGALHGVLALYTRRPRRWRTEEIEALLALAGSTSAALSNAELYQRVTLDKERRAAILENIADGIVAVDRDGNVVLWNRAAEVITGVPAGEALERPPERVLGAALSTAGLVPIRRGSGEIWLSLTEAVMRDPAGQVAGRIFAFRDVSADLRVEEMKTEFVSTVSHELRGPLTSIYGFAETLLREDVPFAEEERKVFLRYIASESDRLTGIVDVLLNVARLEAGDLQVNIGPTDVRPIVSEVVSAVTAAGVNGERFVVDLPEEPLPAAADGDKLRQVLAHLVENAIKYSPEGAPVTVAARRKSETVEFEVSDKGIGIPAAELDRIFRKFYRANADRGGTGLGLFIVQGLVSAMGGRIWVDSAEGEGSTFAFELPAARV